jgi:hypothetical protein
VPRGQLAEARYPDAVTLHAYALGMRLRLHDERHPAVARAIAALADTHLATGDLDVALKGFQEAPGIQVHPAPQPPLHQLPPALMRTVLLRSCRSPPDARPQLRAFGLDGHS